ncbi:hypothetical protein [Planctellipticum variicoloris]|uniref:hypothetical protein n=1 Tax=Planctellipticum variicoloris TaxID=3064265 RepID=UPI00301416DF|nr:hypothetical protein SH412_003405 [Planctomycetaceae bacterium SH412]
MQLTREQLQAVRSGEPITVNDPEIGPECVLVRADVFTGMKGLLYDDSEFSPREAYPLVDRLMAEDDADDPALESYQSYRQPS